MLVRFCLDRAEAPDRPWTSGKPVSAGVYGVNFKNDCRTTRHPGWHGLTHFLDHSALLQVLERSLQLIGQFSIFRQEQKRTFAAAQDVISGLVEKMIGYNKRVVTVLIYVSRIDGVGCSIFGYGRQYRRA